MFYSQYFQAYYRHLIVRKQLLAVEKGIDLQEFCKSITVLDALQLAKRAWWLVTPTTIKKCFRKAGFVKNSTEIVSEAVNEDVIDIPEDIRDEFFKIVDIDANIECSGDLDDDEIVQQVSSASNEHDLDMVDSDDNEISEYSCSKEKTVVVTHEEAICALYKLRDYMEEKGLDQEHLENIEKQIFSTTGRKLVQTSILKFLN